MRILIWDAHTRMGQHFVPYTVSIYMHVLFLYRSLDTAAINTHYSCITEKLSYTRHPSSS